MMETITAMLLAFLERELIKHEPEIQEFVVDQISKLSTILIKYLEQQCNISEEGHNLLSHDDDGEE